MSVYLKNNLYSYQKQAAKKALKKGSFAFYMDMGTGKTITILYVLARLRKIKSIRKVLVICPKPVIYTWKKEIKKHMIEKCYVQGYHRTSRINKRFFDDTSNVFCFLVTNYELILNRDDLGSVDWDALVCDESHRIKNPTGKQAKKIYNLSKKIPNRFLASGTPVAKDEIDLFSQFRVMNSGVLGSRVDEFRSRWCWREAFENFYVWNFRKRKSDEFYNIVNPHIHRISKDEALDLPNQTENIIKFSIRSVAMKKYRELEQTFFTEYEDVEVFTPLAITNLLRLRQFTGGYLDNGDERVKVHSDKMDTFRDWYKDYPDKKLVIFANFRKEIDDLIDFFGDTCLVLDGRTKNKGNWIQFQEDPSIKNYVVQIASGGVGIELHSADTAVFYSTNFSHIDYEQAKSRLHRKGQTKKCTFIHLVADKTVDEDMYYVLKQKNKEIKNILTSMKRRY